MSADTRTGDVRVDSVVEGVTAFAWPRAVATGAVAFLLGYLLTVAVIVFGPGSTKGPLVSVLVLIAFVFYSAHNVPAVIDGTTEVNYLQYVAQPSTPDPAVPLAVYYAVPLLVLVAMGAVAAWHLGDEGGAPVDALLTGLGVAAGYAAVALLGTLVFRTRSLFGGLSTLDVGAAAAYGFAYPLAFATFAAVLVQFARYVRRPAQA